MQIVPLRVIGVAARGFARAHVRAGSPATKQRADQDVRQTPITHVRLVGGDPVADAGGVVHPQRLVPHGLAGDDTAASERQSARDHVVGQISTRNRFRDGRVGERADGREESTAFELPECDTFHFPHLGGTVDLDFGQHDRFSPSQGASRTHVPVLVEPGVDVVGDADRELDIGLLGGNLPRNSAVVVGSLVVIAAGGTAGGEAQGHDREGCPPQDVGKLHGGNPHW